MNFQIETEIYREFKSAEESETWAWQHYANLLGLLPEDELYKMISSYTGSYYKAYNKLLRTCPPLDSIEFRKINFEDYADLVEEIYKINRTLKNYSLPENITVYRFSHKKDIRKLCGKKIFCVGMEFSDKAFFSTTLVKDKLERFRKENRCDCLLKLYLPQGFPGAYVSFKQDWSCLNEQEFLLPPNVKFRILKIHYFTYPLEIECIAICD